MKDKHPEVMNNFPPKRNSQVSFSNYTRTPYNTWGFRNIDSVTHTAMLPRGGALPKMNEKLDPQIPGKIIEDGNGDKLPLDKLLEKHDADGFLVMRDGRVVYEN